VATSDQAQETNEQASAQQVIPSLLSTTIEVEEHSFRLEAILNSINSLTSSTSPDLLQLSIDRALMSLQIERLALRVLWLLINSGCLQNSDDLRSAISLQHRLLDNLPSLLKERSNPSPG